MRLFIALEIPPLLQDEIAAMTRPLRAAMPGRFIPRENLHVTLAFIGDVPSATIPVIEDAINAAARNRNAIPLRAARLGKFGRRDNATFWIGFNEEPQLMSLVERLREELHHREIPFDDKAFLPHVTIARRARIPKGDLPALPFPNPAQAERITLFKSTLSHDGASYEEIYRVELRESEHHDVE